jgi:tRNA pseudouridine38-40 synthase
MHHIPEPIATRFRFTVAYDGTAYAGWQVQPNGVTVQETIEKVLEGLVGAPVKLHGSGRTDQGVHGRGQVAHADLVTRMDAGALFRALNARLPADVRVVDVRPAAPDFHARRSAVAKEYRYFLWNDPVLPPDRRLYAGHCYRPLDVTRMQQAAARFVGEHDFASFTANPDRLVESTVRQVFLFRVRRQGALITFRVRGSGFLYKQVRSMVGFLVRVGEGAEAPEAVTELLAQRAARTARVPTAAPQGLSLWQVFYPRARGGAARRPGAERAG